MQRRIKRADAVSALTGKLSVELVQTKEVHGWLFHEGRKILRFTLPPQHRGSELSLGAARRLLHDSKLSEPDFYDLIDCPMTRDDYLRQLEARGFV